ncbi:XRE family transcriptional regulator [Actinomadura darangshiensis]|uniref:XRE family transcriptional regulator n=1 Tax=Actinomadura darangshiensis TaxID=705336 RepID=A0A4R5BJH9_9ACTN|nr:helix-turn-helix transcriptional regulator [Actinomadura darangshiensis]TDD85120.1 XRE family transcriptional regulator [Actinomadura darangshiensis]
MASDQHDPDALRVHFGEELRRTRMRKKLSQNQLASALGCTPQWICQLEKADKTVSEQTALDLDTYFKTDGWDQEDGHFHRIYTTIRRVGRSRVLRPGFDTYRLQEAQAIGVRAVAAQLVPGLLQTEGYARGIMDQSEPEATLDARVAVRMERQEILDRPNPPEAMFVLDESALRRPVGGSKTMADQIDHLVEMARRPNVRILVMPFERVTPLALGGGFILLSFAREPDLMYVETGHVSQLIENKDVLFRAGVHFTLVMGEALGQAESIAFMLRAREEYL